MKTRTDLSPVERTLNFVLIVALLSLMVFGCGAPQSDAPQPTVGQQIQKTAIETNPIYELFKKLASFFLCMPGSSVCPNN